jgi:cytochrome o ubiquinol oxidase subunit 1
MVGLAALGAFATFVAFAWRDISDYVIPADKVARMDRANRASRQAALERLQAAR